MARILFGLALGCSLLGICAQSLAGPPSNDRVDKEVDEIIKNPDYDWLRKGGKEASRSSAPRHGKMSGKAGGAKGSVDPESTDGCSFEPNFQDPERPDDDGCGNSGPGDCACSPDLGNCACEPVIGNCGACAPAVGNLVPLGYGVGILALVLIIFFVVRALIRKLPEVDTLLEDDEDHDDDDERIRISRIHRLDPASLLDKAHEAAGSGDYKKAVGYVYLLAISTLSKTGYVTLERSTTNWHITQQTRKNGGPVASIDTIIRQFEDLFFGNYVPQQSTFDTCLSLFQRDIRPLEAAASPDGSSGEGGNHGN